MSIVRTRFAIVCGVASLGLALAQAAPKVAFESFEYSGQDKTFDRELKPGEYHNPILTGFYPDPSICKAGDDYYMTNSTFAYFPGLPIFHSKDMVNWNLIGHAIDRPEQLTYDGLRVSMGIFAPAITYHDGLFYLIGTHVTREGNFVMTAEDPAGPWSDPYILEFTGIDPSLFFDDDGRAWIVNNDNPEGEPLYDGHRAIRIQEFDQEKMQVKGPRPVLVNGGVDISTKPIWIEGPHIYKKDGWYYLSCAEGGTGPQHSQVVFRSKKVTGPYEAWEGNPILTQRHLDNQVPGAVTCVGHADLEIGPDGNWWATFLGVRPYDGYSTPMGRETFLMPVEWTDDGWPTILPMEDRVPLFLEAPNGAVVKQSKDLPLSGNFTWRDEFDGDELSPAWIMLRSPKEQWWSLGGGWNSSLSLVARSARLTDLDNPSFLARRVQHHDFAAHTVLEVPQEAGISAGLVLFQNDRYHYYLGVRASSKGATTLFLERLHDGEREILRELKMPQRERLALRVRASEDRCSFDFAASESQWIPFVGDLDAKMVTTHVAGGFVGATVGMHARTE